MTDVITDEQLHFLNENLDLVGEYLHIPKRKLGIYAKFDQITHVTSFEYKDSFKYKDKFVCVGVVCHDTNVNCVWLWQPMLAYVEENANPAPIFK